MSDISDFLLSAYHGIDSSTGEVFDGSIFELDAEARRTLLSIAILTYPEFNFKKPISENLLNRPIKKIFAELRAWRADVANTIELPAYCVFSNAELLAIAGSDFTCKEHLISVPGISHKRYELYADEIWEILKDYL